MNEHIVAIIHSMNTVRDANSLLNYFGVYIWLAGWYILYQITKLKFLKIIIAGDICYVFASKYLFYFFLRLTGHPRYASDQFIAMIMITEEILSIGGTLLTIGGAALGLRYLQRKWTQMEKSQQLAPGDCPPA